ncbi:MAG: hypothetical protein WAN36_11815 [Calditrichia bacterium]
MDKKELSRFLAMRQRIDLLTGLVDRFSRAYIELQREVEKLQQKSFQNDAADKIADLEGELKKAKHENKLLKEREKAIRTKIERLNVKLEQINL